MAVIDVLLALKPSTLTADDLASREPPLSRQVEITPGVQLAVVLPPVARAVYHVCKFRGVERRDDTAMYGFVRYDPPGGRWDEDNVITRALFLSHLVQPNEAGFEFAARIETDASRHVVKATPATILPTYAQAYACPGVARRWLTQTDAEQLKALIPLYDDAREYLRDKRLGMAVSLFGDSCFIFHGRPRAALLAAALEGLVCISSERALKQFVVRIPALAAEVGLPQFDLAWATRIYKLRSKLAHGVPLFQTPEEHVRRRQIDELETSMTEMDDLLRQLIRRALFDREFADTIQNVESRWPVSKNGCATCRSSDPTLGEVRCPRCNSTWK